MTAGEPKPLRADARRNRQAVLDAASAAFAAEGLAVPLDEIARRAGVGAGTVYRHFPTKEALFEAIVADSLHEQAERARALLDAPDPAAALDDAFRRMVEHGTRNRAFREALAQSGVDMRGEGGAVQAGGELMAALEGLATRAREAGVVRAGLTARHVKAMLIGVLAASAWLGDDAESRDQLTAMVCAGFRPAT